MTSLENRVALISGAAHPESLGGACAARFANAGAKVMLADVNADDAKDLADTIGPAAQSIHLDVTDRAAWDAAVAATTDAFGGLDILVNAAGISEPGDIETVTEDNWRRHQSINLDGTLYGCQTVISAMRARGGGSIINISSMLALRPGAMFLSYCASKAAVTTLTKCVALQLADAKIRCNSVHPGAIETPMLERYLALTPDLSREEAYAGFAQNHPMGRCGQPEEVAEACLFLASDRSSFTTGTELTVDGGGTIRE
ncbi:MAG: glucose 1-dehydrogenase [Pseudomonadota bacterium]